MPTTMEIPPPVQAGIAQDIICSSPRHCIHSSYYLAADWICSRVPNAEGSAGYVTFFDMDHVCMAGNVWQWCSDWYRVDTKIEAASKNVCRDPRGPTESCDPGDPYSPKRLVKGASFLAIPPPARVIARARDAGRRPTSVHPIQVSDA